MAGIQCLPGNAGHPTAVIYLNDPQTVPPEDLLTRVEFPICSEPA